MSKTSYILLLLLGLSINIYSQISFNASAPSTGSPGGNRATIFITGPTTGDQLRTFIQANPAAGSVVNRDITFSAELKIQGAGTLTDNNAVYHFPGIFRYAPQSGVTVTFTDVTIHYTGSAKGHSYNFTPCKPREDSIYLYYIWYFKFAGLFNHSIKITFFIV